MVFIFPSIINLNNNANKLNMLDENRVKELFTTIDNYDDYWVNDFDAVW